MGRRPALLARAPHVAGALLKLLLLVLVLARAHAPATALPPAYLGEIRMMGSDRVPTGWALCDGTALSIAENEALFSLIGTTFGGNGQTTFQLPDFRGRAPLHTSPSYPMGSKSGAETVQLNSLTMPPHSHQIPSSLKSFDTVQDGTQVEALSTCKNAFGSAATFTVTGVLATGSATPLPIMPPFTVVNYIISLYGVYPSPA